LSNATGELLRGRRHNRFDYGREKSPAASTPSPSSSARSVIFLVRNSSSRYPFAAWISPLSKPASFAWGVIERDEGHVVDAAAHVDIDFAQVGFARVPVWHRHLVELSERAQSAIEHPLGFVFLLGNRPDCLLVQLALLGAADCSSFLNAKRVSVSVY
jgi:hypothetical protein